MDIVRELRRLGYSAEIIKAANVYRSLYKGDIEAFVATLRGYIDSNDTVTTPPGNSGENQRRVEHDYDGDSLNYYGYSIQDPETDRRW